MAVAKQFATMIEKFKSKVRWTPRWHKELIESSIEEVGVKKYMPGVQSSPQWKESIDKLAYLRAMTDEELDNPDLLKGLRVRRIAWKTEKSEKEVKEFLSEFFRMAEIQRFVKVQEALGNELPDSHEALTMAMVRHPSFQNVHTMSKRQISDFRRRKKRGY